MIQPIQRAPTSANFQPIAPSTEPWGRSKCTRVLLASFEEAGILCAGRWRIPAAGEVIPNPREGEFVCFTSHLERGLRFPTSLFFHRLCAYYDIQPSDRGPHSIEQLPSSWRSASVTWVVDHTSPMARSVPWED